METTMQTTVEIDNVRLEWRSTTYEKAWAEIEHNSKPMKRIRREGIEGKK
jgi:hypothetical protein